MPLRPLCPVNPSPRPAARTRLARVSAGQAEHRALGERVLGPVRLNLAQGAEGWLEGVLSLKVHFFGPLAGSGLVVTAWVCR